MHWATVENDIAGRSWFCPYGWCRFVPLGQQRTASFCGQHSRSVAFGAQVTSGQMPTKCREFHRSLSQNRRAWGEWLLNIYRVFFCISCTVFMGGGENWFYLIFAQLWFPSLQLYFKFFNIVNLELDSPPLSLQTDSTHTQRLSLAILLFLLYFLGVGCYSYCILEHDF